VPGGQAGLGDLAAEAAGGAGEKEDLRHDPCPFRRILNTTPL
jgi:hypothetical protein